MSDVILYLAIVCSLIAGIPTVMCCYFLRVGPAPDPWSGVNHDTPAGGHGEIYSEPMTCMDCGGLTGDQLWRQGDDGRIYYAESKKHTCHRCDYRMVNRLDEAAPEY